MATVNLAACKIAAVLFGFERWQTLLAVGLLNVVFAAHSGLWGVLVIDMIQFFIKMSAVIAAAYFAVTLPQVGGLQRPGRQSSRTCAGPGGLNYLNMLPDFTNNWDLAVAVFIMPHRRAVVGGVVSGRGAGRRQLHRAAHAGVEIGEGRAGRHAVLQRGALCAAAVAVDSGRPGVADRLPAAVGHAEAPSRTSTRAWSATTSPSRPCCASCRSGWMGLMLGGLVAANSSTILTHLNWGASYLVHDFYRRFVQPRRNREALRCGRAPGDRSAVRALVLAGLSRCDTAQDSFQPDPAGRRRHRAALPAALVLVARHRLVRNRGHGQFVRGLDHVSVAAQATALFGNRPRTSDYHRLHHRLLDPHRLYLGRRPTARSSSISTIEVHPFGPGWTFDSHGSGGLRRGSRQLRAEGQYPAGHAGLGLRSFGHLVGVSSR